MGEVAADFLSCGVELLSLTDDGDAAAWFSGLVGVLLGADLGVGGMLLLENVDDLGELWAGKGLANLYVVKQSGLIS